MLRRGRKLQCECGKCHLCKRRAISQRWRQNHPEQNRKYIEASNLARREKVVRKSTIQQEQSEEKALLWLQARGFRLGETIKKRALGEPTDGADAGGQVPPDDEA